MRTKKTNSKKDKQSKFYADKFWYINTYESLGSQWLYDSLEKLMLPKDYVLINLSANAGYYEKDVYLLSRYGYICPYFEWQVARLKAELVEIDKNVKLWYNTHITMQEEKQ